MGKKIAKEVFIYSYQEHSDFVKVQTFVEETARELSFHNGVRDADHYENYLSLCDAMMELRSLFEEQLDELEQLKAHAKRIPGGYAIVKF